MGGRVFLKGGSTGVGLALDAKCVIEEKGCRGEVPGGAADSCVLLSLSLLTHGKTVCQH